MIATEYERDQGRVFTAHNKSFNGFSDINVQERDDICNGFLIRGWDIVHWLQGLILLGGHKGLSQFNVCCIVALGAKCDEVFATVSQNMKFC